MTVASAVAPLKPQHDEKRRNAPGDPHFDHLQDPADAGPLYNAMFR